MKHVVLIGDSIRMGYQETVRQRLAGAAEVWWPEINGGTTVNVLVHLHDWVTARRPDVVHVNAGLHDLKTLAWGERETIVPIPFYERNVEQIVRLSRERGGAEVLWATTTPINERAHHERRRRSMNFDRREADVDAFNAAAVPAARRGGAAAINDLHAAVMDAGRDRLLKDDGVHFNEAGAAWLGRCVADAIRAWL